MFGQSRPFSYFPRSASQDDFPQQRQPFHPDDTRGAPLQRNSIFRPSGKSIYRQRKEYSETLNKQSDNIHVRVEHLFTCGMDGQELKTLEDCMSKLKRLDAKSRLWPQEMIMEVQGGYLLLCDIETKAELDYLPLNAIRQSKAVLDSCAYNSVLILTVEQRNKHVNQVYMFQCEETGAELLKADLDKAIRREGGYVEPRKDSKEIRANFEGITGKHIVPPLVQRETTPSPPASFSLQWREPSLIENLTAPRAHIPIESKRQSPIPQEYESGSDIMLPPEKVEADWNAEIFNHVVEDLEIFMDKVLTVEKAKAEEREKGKRKGPKLKMKSSKKKSPAISLPSTEEYVSCLQKIKYGFNLLAQLEGKLDNPPASEFVHMFFTILTSIMPLYPADVPPNVVSPLLTVVALRFLSQEVSPNEEMLWRSLGDSWNLPKSRWPVDVSPYTPQFYNGWQPPISPVPSPPPYQSRPVSRNSNQNFPSGQPYQEEPVSNGLWGSRPSSPSGEQPMHMRVIYDFMARNNRELSLMKGDVVQVIQKTKQWWLVRNNREEEGYVPQNVLEPMRSAGPREGLSVSLNMASTSAQVKAWLEYKGFSRITVASLGVLNGKQLLTMTKDQIRSVCPEEGGKVFFQLQAVKSSLALSSEQSGMYNGHF